MDVKAADVCKCSRCVQMQQTCVIPADVCKCCRRVNDNNSYQGQLSQQQLQPGQTFGQQHQQQKQLSPATARYCQTKH